MPVPSRHRFRPADAPAATYWDTADALRKERNELITKTLRLESQLKAAIALIDTLAN